MIEIQLNGESRQFSAGTTVSDMIAELGFADKRIAIEYNEEILPKSHHASTVLQGEDRIEVVHAIGGG